MKTNPHILLIDDDHIFCMIAKEMLTNAGFSVKTASNGHKGIQLLRDHPTLFDAILLDRIMPEFSGLDALHKLCLIPEIRDIPVILLTAYASDKHVETATMYGVFYILHKPIDTDALVKTLNQALRENHRKTTI